MKKLSPLVIAASLLALSPIATAIAAEPAATANETAPRADFPLPPAERPPSGPEADAKPASVEGKLVRYLINPFGEIDGLLVEGGKTAKVPPHMGAALTASLKVGDQVSIQGRSPAAGTLDAFSVTNTETKQVIVRGKPSWADFKLPHWVRTMRLSSLKASSKVVAALNGPRGEPNGVVLEDGTVVRLGPNQAYAFQSLLKPGADLSVTGYGTENEYGRAIEASAIGPTPDKLQPIDQ